ncbi:MAG: YtxH domain-containing protein [Candidatus Thiodiazotropha sp.]
MENQTQEQQHNGNQAILFLIGMLLGGLAGAAAMLLMAPQSGKKTRDQIQHKSIELRDQATETMENAMAQVRQTAQQITGDVREKAEELQQRGHDTLDEQRERLSTFIEGRDKDIEVPA